MFCVSEDQPNDSNNENDILYLMVNAMIIAQAICEVFAKTYY